MAAVVEPGQSGFALTVFSGTRIEQVPGRVEGTLPGGGPGGSDLILVRLSGPRMEELGGIPLGMSGSPVLIGGRLIGAVAMILGDDQTLAGVTPIEEMLRVVPGAAVPGARAAALPRPPENVRPLEPLLVTSGIRSRAALDYLEKHFGVPARPAPGGGLPAVAASLERGSAVGAALVLGDVEIGFIGTVTEVEGRRVWAFGHPLLFEGRVSYPMTRARIVLTGRGGPLFPPFKLGDFLDVVGTFTEDRAAAVAGLLDRAPSLAPYDYLVTDADRGREAKLSCQGLRSPRIAQNLAFTLGLEAGDRAIDRIGQGTATVDMEMSLAGVGFTVRRRDRFFDGGDITFAMLLPINEALSIAADNPFRSVELVSLRFVAQITAARRTALVRGLSLPGGTRLARGATAEGRVAVLPFGASERPIAVSFRVPPDFPTGSATLRAIPGSFLDFPEFAADPEAAGLDQVYARFMARPRNDDIVLRLVSAGADATVATQLTDWVLDGEVAEVEVEVV